MKEYDVIIVGGGPAGSSCGHELAKAGTNVALFDHSHPREKLCGGAIPRRFFNDFRFPKGVKKRIIHWIITEDRHGHRVKLYQKFGGVTTMRKEFDLALLKKAKKAGVIHRNEQVRWIKNIDKKWIIKTNKKQYKAVFIVGADGCPSLVRRYVLGDIPKEHLSHCVGYHIFHDSTYLKEKFEDAIELHFLGEPHVKRGYVWVFPKTEYITVGLGTALGQSRISYSLENFLKTHSAAKRIVIPPKRNLHAHLLPFVNSSKFYDLPTTGKNWALIGDAAGHVNPITGEGIYYAMMGGKLAAKAYLDGDISLFEKYWREKYGTDLYWGARMQKIFYNSKIIDMAIKLGQKSEGMQEILADIISSRVPYGILFKKKIIKKIPKITSQVIQNLIRF